MSDEHGELARRGGGAPSKRGRRGQAEELARAVVEYRFDEIVQRFLNSEDEKIALDCFKFLFDHAFGKARQRGDDGPGTKQVKIQFDIGNRPVAARIDRSDVLDADVVSGDDPGVRPAPGE